jgi:hypothetical protein
LPATGERKRFSSAILPPWCRRFPKISEVLPLLYLHGLSSGDFVPPPGAVPRQRGRALPATVTRLTQQWQADHTAFMDRDLAEVDYLRTTNPIESTFSTVRLRTKVTRGAGSRTAALAMVFKLVESAQQRWRALNAPHLVALVRAGARFERGQLVERPEAVAA